MFESFPLSAKLGMIERRDRTVLHMGFDSLAAVVAYLGGVAVLYQLR